MSSPARRRRSCCGRPPVWCGRRRRTR